MEATGDFVVEERDPGLWWITINRPKKHNALSRGVLDQLAQVMEECGVIDRSRLIVLTGAGDRYFAAGGDLVDLSNVRDEAEVLAMTDQARFALDVIRECPVPVVALLNGDAIGGGAELALSCDMRMQSERARIGFVQAKLAITSAWGGGVDLCGLVGAARAMRMMSRCELIDARTALEWGLSDVVIGTETREEDISGFLEPMLKCTAHVLRGIKAQTRAYRLGMSYDQRRSVEQSQLVKTWLHQDHWVAADSLLTKGKK